MEVEVADFTSFEVMDLLAHEMNEDVHSSCKETTIKLENAGSGQITGLSFDYGLELLLFDCCLKDPLAVVVSPNEKAPVTFNFCTKGSLVHRYGEDNVQYHLGPHLGSINVAPNISDQCFQLPADEEIVLTIMLIHREEYRQKIDCEIAHMPENMATIFQTENYGASYLYQSTFSLNISECIAEMRTNRYKDLVRATYMEAKVLELLSLQIKQFRDDQNPHGYRKLIRKYDVQQLKKAKDVLVQDLADAPTIPELAKEVGLNQQKLKKGFKLLYGKTVYNYLREARLQSARILLVDGSLSVAEISEHVGYRNKSHFAKRFKERFGILPKDYSKRIMEHFGLEKEFSN